MSDSTNTNSHRPTSVIPGIAGKTDPATDAAVEPIATIVFDQAGTIRSFHSSLMVGTAFQSYSSTDVMGLHKFMPTQVADRCYSWLQQVHQNSSPAQFSGYLLMDNQSIEVEWIFSLIPAPYHRRGLFLGTAYSLTSGEVPLPELGANPGRPNDAIAACVLPPRYAVPLSTITRNVRRTLDLETIWQQTVDGLGVMFSVHHCLMCSYQPDTDTVVVVADYRQSKAIASRQGQRLGLDQSSSLQQAIESSSPVIEWVDWEGKGDVPMLAMATRYQSQVNGLIVLYPTFSRPWSVAEQDLVSELADQVGTAVAHARLFGESHALAMKLQQANASLMEKHRELEMAKRQAEITRKQAEEASRLKSEFLANTSHELRTPLNGMIGFLKLILDGMADDPQEQEEFIQEAHRSALHLLNLINDVLDIAKIEAGKMQIDMTPISLRELFQAVESFTRPQAEQKGLTFDLLIPPTRDEIVLNGNYQRLLQVMLNLVGNAIKFTHEGGVTISAEIKFQKVTFKDATWPGIVKVSVADTGIGVSLEKQDRLFQTFSQVDGDRTRQYGGTGLGLAISQKLVEAMGGVVQFISMGEGLGSTVTFTTLLYQEPVMISTEPSQPVS